MIETWWEKSTGLEIEIVVTYLDQFYQSVTIFIWKF